jgi:hypothetical protein
MINQTIASFGHSKSPLQVPSRRRGRWQPRNLKEPPGRFRSAVTGTVTVVHLQRQHIIACQDCPNSVRRLRLHHDLALCIVWSLAPSPLMLLRQWALAVPIFNLSPSPPGQARSGAGFREPAHEATRVRNRWCFTELRIACFESIVPPAPVVMRSATFLLVLAAAVAFATASSGV